MTIIRILFRTVKIKSKICLLFPNYLRIELSIFYFIHNKKVLINMLINKIMLVKQTIK